MRKDEYSVEHSLRASQPRQSVGIHCYFVLALPLGLAGLESLFSVVNTVILRALPFSSTRIAW
jgi:hypothetical protein